MTYIILSSVAGIISFMILDYVWLAVIAKSTYMKALSTHISVEEGSLSTKVPVIPFVYIVMVIGYWYFVFPKLGMYNFTGAFVFGAFFGFILYTFYNLTNVATLKEYPWQIALIDIVWGSFLVGTVSLIIYYSHAALIFYMTHS